MSKHYQHTLERLAAKLVTVERFGGDWRWPK